MSRKNTSPAKFGFVLVGCLVVLLCSAFQAQQSKNQPAKKDLSGRYEGTARNSAGEVITVTFELIEKEGAISGLIRSSHGDFTITGGSHDGDSVKLEFDANGAPGTIALNQTEDKLIGTWSAGDDGGPVDAKKSSAPPDALKS